MIRKFYLENEYGEKYYFDNRNKALLSQVSGLGFALDIQYLDYGNIYKKADYSIPVSEIQETIIFLNGYTGYKAFVDYLSRSNKEMKLHYQTGVFDAYCLVDISSLTKGELVANTIQSQVIFKKLSYWQNEKVYEINANGTISGKSYPYTYPYNYSKAYGGVLNLKNQGLNQSPLIIEIFGDVAEPEVIIKKNDEIVSTMKLLVTEDNTILKVNSIPTEQEIVMNGNDIYGLQDFEKDNFLYLDHGDYEIEFKPGVATNSICRVTLVEYYLGI
ncbi:MAG: hypothetical protein WC154_00275 [Candidatus Izemoplasmatales bacterium]